MPDDKSGREKQAKRREQRQRRRELEEAIKRLDEPEPSDKEEGKPMGVKDDILVDEILTDGDSMTNTETVTDSHSVTDHDSDSDDLTDRRLLAAESASPTIENSLVDASQVAEWEAVESKMSPLADPTRVPLSLLVGDEWPVLNAAGDERITRGMEPSDDMDR